MAPEHPTSTQHEQALLCQLLRPLADPSMSPGNGALLTWGSWEVPTILQQVQMGWLEPRGWGTPAAIWSYPSLHFEVLGCCKMQKELLGNVVSIKINALTRSQIATANVLLNEI